MSRQRATQRQHHDRASYFHDLLTYSPIIEFRKSNVNGNYPNGDGSLDARMNERNLSWERQTVGRVALEVIPDVLVWVEFGGVLGEELGVQTGIVPQHSFDDQPLVDLASVPQEDDRSGHVAQKLTKERGHMHVLEVVLLEASETPLSIPKTASGRASRDILPLPTHRRRL
jgi:hypothetical protein